jgi:hypothetical protein
MAGVSRRPFFFMDLGRIQQEEPECNNQENEIRAGPSLRLAWPLLFTPSTRN